MQASRLKLGAETIVSLGIGRRRPTPTLLTLPSKWQQAAALGFNHSSRTFAGKAADQPVHATPHYMDYDTLVDMHLVTRQSFGNRPLFGTKRGNGSKAAFEWLTYKDFGKQVDRCRAALASKGIGRGDAVAVISTNREEWAVCAYATYSLGAVYVPMYEEQVSYRCLRGFGELLGRVSHLGKCIRFFPTFSQSSADDRSSCLVLPLKAWDERPESRAFQSRIFHPLAFTIYHDAEIQSSKRIVSLGGFINACK